MDNNVKIYSTQYNKNQTQKAEIESVIMSGIYKFSILGLNQKNISEIKDRIYSALRTQKLTNLKSHNKKIAVNIIPYDSESDNNYDLGIALGCLFSMKLTQYSEDILTTGNLSILGNINSNKNILSTIYLAIKENIKTICCSDEDIFFLKKNVTDISDLLHINNIKIISGKNLDQLNQNIINLKYVDFEYTKTNDNKNSICKLDKLSKELEYVIFLICTKNNILIEKRCDYVFNFIKNLIYYRIRLKTIQLLELASLTNISDDEIISKYLIPYINNIQLHDEKDLFKKIIVSKFGFNTIDNIVDIDKNKLLKIDDKKNSSIIAFYNSCPCGQSDFFFENISRSRCLCLQRNILRHKNKIKLLSENIFHVIINDIDSPINHDMNVTPEFFININRLILNYKDISASLEVDINPLNEKDVIECIKKTGLGDEKIIRKIFNMSIEYEKYRIILYGKNVTKIDNIQRETLDKMIDLFKKDF